MNLSRRALFKVSTQAYSPVFRPPGALEESAFVDQCTRCDRCIDRCPEQIIQRSDGGYPALVFTERGCSGCGICIEVCSPNALVAIKQPSFPDMHIKVEDSCLAHLNISCQACKDSCETQAIRFPLTQRVPPPAFNSDICTGCGECIAVCPNQSIQPVSRLK